MNIFATSGSPVECAKALDDSRVIKMALETAQILSTVARGLQPEWADECGLYKATHVRHPCVLWAGKSVANAGWLDQHGLALCDEYAFRFNRQHASRSVIIVASELIMPSLRTFPRTPFVNCTPHHDLEIHEAYRRTLIDKMTVRKPSYTRRPPPDWLPVRVFL